MKKIYIVLSALAACMACSREVVPSNNYVDEPEQTSVRSFYAILPELSETKTILGEAEDGHHKVSWTDGDMIRIVFGTGDNDYVDAAVAADGSVEADVPEAEIYYAVYPVCNARIEDNTFLFDIPSEQGGKFSEAGFMTASASATDRVLSFTNASGLVSFEVKRDDVSRVVIRSCDGTPISGNANAGIDSVSVSLNGPGVYYAAFLKDADLKAGLGMRYYKGSDALPGVLSIAAVKAEGGKLWNLGCPEEMIHEGDYSITPESQDLLRKLLNTHLSEGLDADGKVHAWRVGGKKIHLAAGTYSFNAESGYLLSSLGACSPVQIIGEEGTVIKSEGAGAFSISNAGSFCFENITFDGSTTGGNGAAINWSSTGTLKLKNCVFSNNSAAGAGGALYLSAGTVDIESCIFTGNNAAAGVAYNKDGGLPSGGAVYAICADGAVAGTKLKINHCTFADNTSGTYGAHLSIYTSSGDASCSAWLNACSFREGYSDNGGKTAAQSGERYYGKSIHSDGLADVGFSELAFNNCTVAGKAVTPASDAKWNGLSLVSGERTRMLAVNSTFFGASNGTIFKNLYRGGKVEEVYMMNCLLTNLTKSKTSINLYAETPVVKADYNVYDDRKNGYTIQEHDTKGILYTDIAWTWNDTDKLYEWSTAKEISNYATSDIVETLVKESMPEYDAWLKTLSAAPYGIDQAGHTRNAGKLNPGAWDAGL